MTQNRDKMDKLFREARIEAKEDKADNNKVHLSLSSEEPYERWFGTEILSHDEGCVDLSRLNEIGVL